MPHIPRVRPQSKRKAIVAHRLLSKYRELCKEAAESGDANGYAKYWAKQEYWRDRYNRHSRMAHTW